MTCLGDSAIYLPLLCRLRRRLCLERIARLRCQDSASTLVEFSVTMPVLVMFALAAISFGLVVQENIVVTNAAVVGARYGANGHSIDTAGMQSAAAASASGVTGFTSTATRFCTCTPGGTVVSCLTACLPYPITPAVYVTVTTSATAPLLFKITGLPSSLPLVASATLRAPW